MLISARDAIGRHTWVPRMSAQEVQLINYEGQRQFIQVRLTEAGGFILHQPQHLLTIRVLDGHTIEVLLAEVRDEDSDSD